MDTDQSEYTYHVQAVVTKEMAEKLRERARRNQRSLRAELRWLVQMYIEGGIEVGRGEITGVSVSAAE